MPLQQDKLLHARHRPPGWLHRDAGYRVCADAAVRANCRLLAVSTLHAARDRPKSVIVELRGLLLG